MWPSAGLQEWTQSKSFSFPWTEGAYLTITGIGWEDGGCSNNGLGITCDGKGASASLASSWQAYGAQTLATRDPHRWGQGTGWGAPCNATSAFYLTGQKAGSYARVWGGQRTSALRWQTQVGFSVHTLPCA